MKLSVLCGGLLLSAAMAGLISCGGGGPGLAGGGIGGTGISQGPVTGFGSIFVNGLEIETTGAKIEVDDNQNASQGDLRVGMVVLVEWEKDAGGKYTARRVKYAKDVQGTVQGIDTTNNTLTVLGQTVKVDGLTVFSGTSGVAGTTPLKQDDIIEVSGLRDTTGVIHATRVKVMTGTSEPSELKGMVDNYVPGTNTFKIGVVTVSFSGPVPTGLATGACVEVKGTFDSATSMMNATRVALDDSCGIGGSIADGKEVEVEGFISGLDTAVGTFKVNGQTVRYSNTTQYENGNIASLAGNVRVEVEGTVTGGVLVAKKISFKLGGDDGSASGGGGTGVGGGTGGGGGNVVSDVEGTVTIKTTDSVTVNDSIQGPVKVTVNNDTLFKGGAQPGFGKINVNDVVKVKFYKNSGGVNIAIEVELEGVEGD